MTPFDFINAINVSKESLFDDPQAEKDYVPFIVNRGLSYFPDTVLYANEMNRMPHLSKQMQFEFLRHSITKRKRFSKWAKKSAASDDLAAIMEHYKYSAAKAMEVMSILSSDQIATIKQQMEKGGKS